MGVDTRDKRAACLVAFLPIGRVFPNPDAGAEDFADRQQSAQSYRLAVTAVSIPTELRDLTTVWCQDYQPVLSASGGDDATVVRNDYANAYGYDNEDDLNTAYAKYINAEF